MGKAMKYGKILKYQIHALLKEPLHIGSSFGEKNEILVHPVTGLPFIQASSLCGVLRSYCEKVHSADTDVLFGNQAEDGGSRIRVTDGHIYSDNAEVKLEYRPRVSISPQTGAVTKETIKGTDIEAGHKFEILMIGAGAKVDFSCYLYIDNDEEHLREVMSDIFSGFTNNEMQIGGQKSNGCGYLEVKQLLLYEYDMTTPEGRKAWGNEDGGDQAGGCDITSILTEDVSRDLQFIIKGQTEGELLVKGIALDQFGGDNPDSANIQNSAGEYIVPGSSFKGAIRSRMSSIAEYLSKSNKKKLIADAFGKKGNGKDDPGKTGDLRFFDTIIGNRTDNDKMPARNRIRIDKFTGGVMYKGKFTEKNISGKFDIKILVKDTKTSEKSAGMLLLALRDLAIGAFPIGGGANIGKGYLKIDTIEIKKADRSAVIDVKNGKTEDASGLIGEYLKALKEVG